MKAKKKVSRAGVPGRRAKRSPTAARKVAASEGRSLFAFACHFKRDGGGPWERGLMVQPSNNSDVGVILDADALPVPAPIWDWRAAYYGGTMRVDV